MMIASSMDRQGVGALAWNLVSHNTPPSHYKIPSFLPGSFIGCVYALTLWPVGLQIFCN
jgi:hypothetical protein